MANAAIPKVRLTDGKTVAQVKVMHPVIESKAQSTSINTDEREAINISYLADKYQNDGFLVDKLF